MAVVTHTCTVYANTPKYSQIGNLTIAGKLEFNATLSDILFLAKVPHGAKIVDFMEYHTNGQTAAVIDFGFASGVAAGGGRNDSCLVSAGAVATNNRLSLATLPSNQPLQISVSDNDPARYAILQGKCVSGTFTISLTLNWQLTYRMDGPEPV